MHQNLRNPGSHAPKGSNHRKEDPDKIINEPQTIPAESIADKIFIFPELKRDETRFSTKEILEGDRTIP